MARRSLEREVTPSPGRHGLLRGVEAATPKINSVWNASEMDSTAVNKRRAKTKQLQPFSFRRINTDGI